ncbi:MAG: hypothetical protein JWM44_1314 [Bacilli bacterium]|nr:hypothetical protein [Bacilli bacterium]
MTINLCIDVKYQVTHDDGDVQPLVEILQYRGDHYDDGKYLVFWDASKQPIQIYEGDLIEVTEFGQ